MCDQIPSFNECSSRNYAPRKGVRFLLKGSSVRKLSRGGVNLLGVESFFHTYRQSDLYVLHE